MEEDIQAIGVALIPCVNGFIVIFEEGALVSLEKNLVNKSKWSIYQKEK